MSHYRTEIRFRRVRSVILTVAALLIAGCAVSVASLRENPQAYAGEAVLLRGRVELVVNVPLTDFWLYRFDDGTGVVTVFSTEARERNEQLTLRAEVVAFPREKAVAQAKEARDRIKRFLIQNDLTGRDRAERIAGVILRAVREVSTSVDQVFFLVEET